MLIIFCNRFPLTRILPLRKHLELLIVDLLSNRKMGNFGSSVDVPCLILYHTHILFKSAYSYSESIEKFLGWPVQFVPCGDSNLQSSLERENSYLSIRTSSGCISKGFVILKKLFLNLSLKFDIFCPHNGYRMPVFALVLFQSAITSRRMFSGTISAS